MSSSVYNLLIIGNSVTDAQSVADQLRKGGLLLRNECIHSSEELADALDAGPWDIILFLIDQSDLAVEQIVNIVRSEGKLIPLIALSEHYYDAVAVEALEAGAVDFVPRSRPERVQFAVNREIGHLQYRRGLARHDKALRECGDLFLTLMESSRDAICYVHGGMHVIANKHYLKLFDIENPRDLEDTPVLDHIAMSDRDTFKRILSRLDQQPEPVVPTQIRLQTQHWGEIFKTLQFQRAMLNGEQCVQITVVNPDHEEQHSHNYEPLLGADTFNGVHNSRYFFEALENAVSIARSSHGNGGIAYIELDQFQRIKEQTGIVRSDAILQEVGTLLRQVTEEKGILARISSDVFAWLITDHDSSYISARAEHMLSSLANHAFDVQGEQVSLTASIGIGLISTRSKTAQTILSHADIACTVARGRGGNTFHLFTPSSERGVQIESDDVWVHRIESALERDGFQLLYMPIVSLHAAPTARYEVLLRMRDASGDEIAPTHFISAAEQSGLQPVIDRWVTRNAVSCLHREQNQSQDMSFFIKLSLSTVVDETFLPWLKDILDEYPVRKHSLIFELSETEALNFLDETQSFIKAIAALHCDIALEHFGTQTESFKSLELLPVRYIKIDSSFIENIAENSHRQNAMRRIIDSARAQDIETIAEYVQDAQSLAFLWREGVNYIQGYYLQRPAAELNYDFSGNNEL